MTNAMTNTELLAAKEAAHDEFERLLAEYRAIKGRDALTYRGPNPVPHEVVTAAFRAQREAFARIGAAVEACRAAGIDDEES